MRSQIVIIDHITQGPADTYSAWSIVTLAGGGLVLPAGSGLVLLLLLILQSVVV